MLSYKARRRLSLLILLVGLPLYIVSWPSTSIALIDSPSILIEVLSFMCHLAMLWAFPFKYVFRGVGQADPDQD